MIHHDRIACVALLLFRCSAAAIGFCIFCDAPRTLEGRLAAIGQRHLVEDTRWKLMWVFPKMVVPNNHGFPTKNDHFGVFWGYHHLRKPPCVRHLSSNFNQKFDIWEVRISMEQWVAKTLPFFPKTSPWNLIKFIYIYNRPQEPPWVITVHLRASPRNTTEHQKVSRKFTDLIYFHVGTLLENYLESWRVELVSQIMFC